MKIKHYAHALIGLGIFIAAFSAYGAWYALVGKESAEVESLATQIQVKTQNAARAQEAKSELERALQDEAAIKGYFVNTTDVVPFLESLQGLGQRLGTQVDVESVSSQPGKPHPVLLLAVRITGTFNDVERTLGAIEYEPYDTVITNLTFDTAGGSAPGKPAVWTAAASIRIGTTDIVKTPASTQP